MLGRKQYYSTIDNWVDSFHILLQTIVVIMKGILIKEMHGPYAIEIDTAVRVQQGITILLSMFKVFFFLRCNERLGQIVYLL